MYFGYFTIEKYWICSVYSFAVSLYFLLQLPMITVQKIN